MDKSDKKLLYISFDADSAGRKIGKAILNDDPKEVSKVSKSINLGNMLFEKWAKEHNGVQYSSGGDQGVYSIPEECVKELEQLRKDYHYITGLTVSIGVGKHLSESGQALLMAKLKGKNQIVFFDKETKKEIQQIKKRAKNGKFKSMEEYKIADSYLSKSEDELSCPYCEQTDGVDTEHCKWCHNLEVEEDPCPFCQQDPSQGPKEPEVSEEDCTYCKEKTQEEQSGCPYCKTHPSGPGTSPDSNNDIAPPGSDEEKDQYDKMGMSPPEIGKPNPNEEPPIGQNAPLDTEPVVDAVEEVRDPERSETAAIDPEDNHSREALISIAEQIENEGNPSENQINTIDDADISSGTETEGNVSRPEGYGQNIPGDMGTGGPNVAEKDGEEPDFYNLLEEGLNHNADSIQKDKTITMVSQALMEFKNCKDILEQSKLQMPQLYQASISMLKAMIEMANMLGLGQSGSGDSPGPIGPQGESVLGEVQESLTPEQENEWHNPFPTHPDHGGEQKPGHAPPAKDGGASPQQDADRVIGQPIGKLSAKHTTTHVARTSMPIGAVNVKGQQKVVDNQGKIRFIDRKRGLVMGPSGVPIKPPKRDE